MRRNSLIVLLFCFLLAATAANAASLWLSGNDLYSSKGSRDFKPGDIITIIISEESNAQSKATTNTSKESQIQATSAPQIPFFKKVVGQFLGNNQIKNEFDGQGTTTRSGKLTGTVTATILEVMSNGNILLEGSRSIRVNRETQIMRVRGVARPRDIDSGNAVNSKMLADAQIKFDGNGAVGRVNRPGLITKFMNVIF